MGDVVSLFPQKEEEEEVKYHEFMPELYWTCACEHCLFYLTPVEDSYELVCYGCGKRQRWDK